MKDVIGFEGLYIIYNCGCVFSCQRKDRLGRPVGDKFIKGERMHVGHVRVALAKNGQKYRMTVSRLVAIHFIPNPDNLPYVRHNDDNPANNHYSNLLWGTAKDNSEDMVKRNRQAKGEKNGMFGKRGSLAPNARSVINTKTGKIYDCIRMAAADIGINSTTLGYYLHGRRKNKTTLKFL